MSDTPSQPTPERRETFRLPDVIPMWWRVIPERAFESIRQQFEITGALPVTRLGLEDEIMVLLAPASKEQETFGTHPRQHLLDALDAFDAKLKLLLALACPGQLQAEEGADGKPTSPLTPTRVNISNQGIAFWAKFPRVQRADYLEMQFAIFPGMPFLMRCFAQVVRIVVEDNGITRVACRFELLAPSLQDRIDGHIRERIRRPPSAWDPALIQRMQNQIAPASPPPAAPPPRPTPAPAAPARTPPSTPAPQAAPAPDAQDIGDAVTAEQLLEGLEKGQNAKPIASAGQRASNRRQDFRINDDILFSWKVISETEFQPIEDHFNRHQAIILRRKLEQKQQLLTDIDRRIASMEDEIPTTARLLAWLRNNLDVLFMRAFFPEAENHFYMLISRLHGLTQEFTGKDNVNPKSGKTLAHLKRKLERMIRLSQMDSRTNIRDREAVQSELKKLDLEIPKMMSDLLKDDPTIAEKYRLFNLGIDAIDFTQVDKPGPQDESMGTLFKYEVNLSATGIAYRTAYPDMQKDTLLEMRMQLSGDGANWETFVSYGRSVMIKGPDPSRHFRIACQILTLTHALRERLYVHIVRKQRESLAGRIEVRD